MGKSFINIHTRSLRPYFVFSVAQQGWVARTEVIPSSFLPLDLPTRLRPEFSDIKLIHAGASKEVSLVQAFCPVFAANIPIHPVTLITIKGVSVCLLEMFLEQLSAWAYNLFKTEN